MSLSPATCGAVQRGFPLVLPKTGCPQGFLHRQLPPFTPMRAIKRLGDAVPRGMLLYLLRCSPLHPCLEHPTYNPYLSRVPCSWVPESPEQFPCVRQRAATAGSRTALATTSTAPHRVCFPLAPCFVEMANPKTWVRIKQERLQRGRGWDVLVLFEWLLGRRTGIGWDILVDLYVP